MRRSLKLRHALALGLLQGPTELLPVSSSAHTILIPLLAGWPYEDLDPALRKSFEVALHAGAGLALALDMRRHPLGAGGSLGRHRAAVLALALLPPAIAGLALERVLEQRLGGPRSSAAGLAGGALAMALADARIPGGAAACARRGCAMASRSGSPRRLPWSPGCRATARRSPPHGHAASAELRRTRSRGSLGCR